MAVQDISTITFGSNTYNLKDPTKYTKPSTGVPQTDLAQTVQNKLDKTVAVSDTRPTEAENKLWVDTDAGSGNSYEVPTVAESLAMGVSGASVGDLVRVNAMDSNGKPTSWKRVPLNEIKCNKNLLDNWYFVGGGSQLGYGVFPINQRGQTSYSGIGYGFDRWRLSTDAIVSIATEIVVRNTSSTNRRSFGQYYESPSNLYGKTVTGSILLSNGEMYYGTITLPTSIPSGGTKNISFIDFNNNTLRAEVETSGYIKFSLMIAQDSSLSVLAMKLELGSEQTLAHNEGTEENPVWVLNEIPDYGEELRKCQRYFERIQGQWATIGVGYEETTTSALFYGSCNPKIQKINSDTENVLTGSVYVNDSSQSGSTNEANTVTQFVVLPNGQYSGRANIANGSLVANTPCRIRFRDATSYIDISCEP